MEGFSLPPYVMFTVQTELFLNGINLVPGTVALANESHQNSAALKNITIDTGTTKFNTAIEYDTDVNNTAYSRVKHYIVGGKAYSYAYDEAGNISRIQSPDGSWVEYEYDSLNQLKKEIYSAALPFASLVEGGGTANAVTEGVSYDTIEYSYDSRGNITAKTFLLGDTTVANVPYTYNDTTWKDRLTSYNGVTITYDTIGNPLSWHDGSAMTWQRGRQLATYAKDGVSATYTYNADGIRTAKTVGAVTTTYSVIDGTLRRMTDGTNTLEFIYANGLSSVIYNGTEYWYVFNAQGDVIGLIDASGAYVVEYTYDSWGKPLSKTGTLADALGTLNPFRYRGYIYDEETGFYYVSSRYYDPAIGRWLNADNEIAGVGGDVRGYNQFAYCFNNPVNTDDPTGNWPQWIQNAVTAVKTVVTTAVKTVVNAVKSWGVVKHDVPAYTQGPSPTCWATCELMVESYRSGETLSEIEAYHRGREIAIEAKGDEFENGGHPSNEGREIQCVNLLSLATNLKKGPLYAMYSSGDDAHMVVVTGVDIWKKEVYINNPNSKHGTKSTLNFRQFLMGYPKNGDLIEMPLVHVFEID